MSYLSKNIRPFFIAGALFGLVLFNQACSETSFEKAQTKSSSIKGNETDEAYVQQGQCYEVTCTSLENNTQTLIGSGASGEIITAMAPSGQGIWILELNGDQISKSVNCWADQVRHSGNLLKNQSLCTEYGAKYGSNCSLHGNCTYEKGNANPFSSCHVQEC